jgi:hypothetical protein
MAKRNRRENGFWVAVWDRLQYAVLVVVLYIDFVLFMNL